MAPEITNAETTSDAQDTATTEVVFETEPYRPENHVRIVTAASLFDGHDAAINIMRRILQASGAEVIHLGHNRSVGEIVDCAIQEDAQAIAITSYQGGHLEYFKYMHDLLREARSQRSRSSEAAAARSFPSRAGRAARLRDRAPLLAPDDGRAMGLQGMINDLLRTRRLRQERRPAIDEGQFEKLHDRDPVVDRAADHRSPRTCNEQTLPAHRKRA